MIPMRPRALMVTVALACTLATPVAAFRIELPRDTSTLKSAPGSELATAQCGACHSFDYVNTQPPGKPMAFWKAEVEKMKKVYGAQIPDEQIEPIAQYLTRAYGDGK